MFDFRSVQISVIAALTLAAVGCQSAPKKESGNSKLADFFSMDKGMPWHKDKDQKPGTPVRLVDSWTDTVLHREGQPSERGFGGRIHFYDADGGDPILTEGNLVVYAFDETDRDPIDNRPTKRYVFPAEEFARHMSDSSLGPSYSFWLPWDQVGGEQKEISLICRFEPKSGTLVIGEQTRQRLPGRLVVDQPKMRHHPILDAGVMPAHSAAADGSSSTLAGYEQPISGNTLGASEPSQQMTTTSIALPARFGKR
jgi:hypothetical protein